jgi:hypothetical protein
VLQGMREMSAFVYKFWYPRKTLYVTWDQMQQEDGYISEDVSHRVKPGWLKC